MEYLSKECYDKIAAELENLINVEFPKVKDALSEARAQGDLSENFEYRAARRAQSKMISPEGAEVFPCDRHQGSAEGPGVPSEYSRVYKPCHRQADDLQDSKSS